MLTRRTYTTIESHENNSLHTLWVKIKEVLDVIFRHYIRYDVDRSIKEHGPFNQQKTAGPDLSVWRPWAGSLLEAPTHPQML